ncbi:MAG TPA: histidine phosphatase family protein [Sphingomicrobium sp.]|nr:histidine phosphatase family protein [Sphingomicrobium sp.]
MAATLLLIRHGAHGDLGERLTGRGHEGGLSEAGRQQVEALASELGRRPISAIYTSPRLRTRETAALVATAVELPMHVEAALDEIDFGNWTGRRFADLDGQAEWDRWNRERSVVRCPGGETMREAQARAVAFAIQASAAHAGEVALVTHCDIIRALLCWQERRSLDEILHFEAGPASVTRMNIPPVEQVAA